MATKQIIILRTDLNMRKGKMCAQASHASLGVLYKESFFVEGGEPGRDFYLSISCWDELVEWLTDARFTKIVVGIDNEAGLLELEQKAKDNKLPHYLVKDAGLTEFGGVPTYTALAIGPGNSKEIDKITGHLKLL